MADEDDAASVRIEIERPTPAPVRIPGGDPDRPQPNRSVRTPPSRATLGIGVALALTSLIAIFFLRPAPGETADGTPRIGPTTTVAITTTEPSAVVPRVDVIIGEGVMEVKQIIPWTTSYIALGGGATSDLPLIYVSPDGEFWSRFPALLTDVEPAAIEGGETIERTFFALGESADGGLAVSMLEIVLQSATNEPLRTFSTRLVSADGRLWSPDPEFQRINLGAALGAIPLINTPELTVVGAFRGDAGNPLIEKVLLAHVLDPAINQGCWTDASGAAGATGDNVVLLGRCSGGLLEALRSDQLVDPATSNEFGRCLEQLSGRSGPPLEVFMQQRGEASIRVYTQPATISAFPVATPDGRVAVLGPGQSLDGAPACEPFDQFEDQAPTDPGIALLAPQQGSQRLPSLGAWPETQLFGLPASIAATDTEVLVPTAGGVYAVDIEGGDWVERAQPMTLGQTVWIASNGVQLFTFGGGKMFMSDADEEWAPLDLSRELTPDRILYADDERVFFAEGHDLVVIELPSTE